MKLLLLSIFIISSHAYGFRLNTNIGAKFEDAHVKIYVTSNSTCDEAGISNSELLSIVMDAADDFWNKVPTSNLKIKEGGILETSDSLFLTGELCANDSESDCNASTSVPNVNNIVIACNSDTTKNFPSSSYLAISAPLKISGSNIEGSIILINNSANTTFKNLSRSQMVSVLAHEIGHAVGLGHSNKSEALMYYKNSDKFSKLAQDDIDGISYLYPNKLDGCTGFLGTMGLDDEHNDENQNTFLLSILLGIMLSLLLLILAKIKSFLTLHSRRKLKS